MNSLINQYSAPKSLKNQKPVDQRRYYFNLSLHLAHLVKHEDTRHQKLLNYI